VNFQVKIKHVLTPTDTVSPDGTFDGLKVEVRPIPGMIKMAGYETTSHSKLGDIAKEWREFKLSDCAVPGVRSDGK
jgi:hypothetical protein